MFICGRDSSVHKYDSGWFYYGAMLKNNRSTTHGGIPNLIENGQPMVLRIGPESHQCSEGHSLAGLNAQFYKTAL